MRKSKTGRLSNRIIIQAAIVTPDGMGGDREAYVDAVTVWAEALPGGSNRSLDKIQNMIYSDVVFRIRSGTGIGKYNRILYEGRACVIEGVRDWEQDREFQFIDCRYDEQSNIAGTGGGIVIPDKGLKPLELSYVVGANTIVDANIIGAVVVNVYRNGIALHKVANAVLGEDVKVDTVTGTLTFGAVFGANEYIYIVLWLGL